jgi:hypothetical protein
VLRLGDEEVRTYKREARSQFAVLDALQAAGWPTQGVRLSKGCDISLKDTVRDLNIAVAASRLRFGFSDKQVVTWHVKPE